MAEIETLQGYAVVLDNKIDIRTVSPTRRGAIVNWLVVHVGCFIYNTTTDEQINEMWSRSSGNAVLKLVNITENKKGIKHVNDT